MSLNGGQGEVKLLTEWVKIFPLTYSLIFSVHLQARLCGYIHLNHFISAFHFILTGGRVRNDTGAQKGQLYIGNSTFLNTYFQSRNHLSCRTNRTNRVECICEPSQVSFISASRHISQPPNGLSLHTWGFLAFLFFTTSSLWVMKSKAFGRRDFTGRPMDLAGSLGLGRAQKKEGSKGYSSL